MADRLRVLLIDDSPMDARIVLQLLASDNSAEISLSMASTLAEGIAKVNSDDFDAVLLDLSLPGSSGLETLAQFRNCCPAAPVLVLTGSDSEEMATQAVQEGAQDYLVKWTFPPQSLLRALRYAIERQKRRQLEASVRATEAELHAARDIQQKLCPALVPVLPGFELAGAWYPAKATCGDYYDFIRMDSRYLAIAIGDVCGHGLGPALVMAETRACLRTLAASTLDVAEILTRINRLLAEDLAGDRFVTLLLARLDVQTRALVYAGAGHQAFVLDAEGNVATLDSTSQPLGLDAHLVVRCGEERQLRTGDLLLMVTDGVQEALAPEGEMFGIERMLEIVRTHHRESAQSIVSRLYEAIDVFSRGTPQADDFTAIVLKAV